MRGAYRGRVAAFGALSVMALLAACGSDAQPTSVVVVPPAQQAPATTTVVPSGSTVLPPGSRVVCADGRAPPCPY